MVGLRTDGGALDHGFVRDRVNDHCLLYEPVEELPSIPGSTPVEAKREFVEIGVQLLTGQCTLMGTRQPAFQQGAHPVYAGQQGRRCFAAGVDQTWSVFKASLLQPCIGLPSVRDDYGARFNRVFHEGDELVWRSSDMLVFANVASP